ncbi:hypothetical protein BD626DRAFT_570402 [Schizophyllum amplum]|uniref:Uncharacterized protein n=1 Tax=Schizophyllum amplum TaxID=97359 RepID=A0A550CA63_9AGAR|nr:hypothetical protein BD626DRAFT_570402 [Auriculariopsis ampla]
MSVSPSSLRALQEPFQLLLGAGMPPQLGPLPKSSVPLQSHPLPLVTASMGSVFPSIHESILTIGPLLGAEESMLFAVPPPSYSVAVRGAAAVISVEGGTTASSVRLSWSRPDCELAQAVSNACADNVALRTQLDSHKALLERTEALLVERQMHITELEGALRQVKGACDAMVVATGEMTDDYRRLTKEQEDTILEFAQLTASCQDLRRCYDVLQSTASVCLEELRWAGEWCRAAERDNVFLRSDNARLRQEDVEEACRLRCQLCLVIEDVLSSRVPERLRRRVQGHYRALRMASEDATGLLAEGPVASEAVGLGLPSAVAASLGSSAGNGGSESV